MLTSASWHDSQVAIPLATLSAERTTNLYDLMDAASDAEQMRPHSRSLGDASASASSVRRTCVTTNALLASVSTVASQTSSAVAMSASVVPPR